MSVGHACSLSKRNDFILGKDRKAVDNFILVTLSSWLGHNFKKRDTQRCLFLASDDTPESNSYSSLRDVLLPNQGHQSIKVGVTHD